MASLRNERRPRRRNVPNEDLRRYVLEDSVTMEQGWASRPEIPTSDEIMGTTDQIDQEDVIQLIPNQVTGPWPSKVTYLKAHYELLREDAVAPLRDAVAYARDNRHLMDSSVVAIYEDVHIVGFTFSQKGVAARVRFSAACAGKRIVWKYSKRLIAGTIVALSSTKDRFKSKCAVAIVAARPLEGVERQPHEIDIFFTRAEEVEFNPQQSWVMVEARSGYFESARHTMTALQRMTKESFPLSEHICTLDPAIGAPGYVKVHPIVDISPALSIKKQNNRINILKGWPKSLLTDFDPSQWAALRHLLTKRLAIVQGPPGTGKTYVSVGALKILLSNMTVDDPPIIIAAQTNHALDQLLNRLSGFERNYVRLGGRSTDPEIKKHTLFEIRQKERIGDVPGSLFLPAKKELQKIIDRALMLLRPFGAEKSGSPLPASLFLKYGLLTQAQYSSLQKGAAGWIRPGSQSEEDPIITWLSDSLQEFDAIYREEDFDDEKEDIDLDFRQSTEFGAEQAFEDDDFENLGGQYLPLKEGFIGRGGASGSKRAAREAFLMLDDLWKVPAQSRGSVYNLLRKQIKENILAEFRKLLSAYDETCMRLQVGKWETSYMHLQAAKVIGVTTTGLSKYRALISCLKPKIVVIEEAAEVIEAPVAAACIESLQHLILVGDHKQLQGRCSVPELEGYPFYLNVSMFERLVHNGIEFKTLSVQRRMAPEISELLTPIYGCLQNHPSVQGYAKVPGMGEIRSFFFCHEWLEESDDSLSKFNENEAQMIVRFFLYLVLNGIPVSDITILTFYNGQRKKLLRLLSKIRYLQAQFFKVVTVDSYQGEENEVVILSLVRSSRKIGFLSDEHRTCVAISRAKRGFYIFGNGQALALADPLWWLITKTMNMGSQQRRRVGFKLPLTCKKHGNKTFIQNISQWNTINGGCELMCSELLPCGHVCSLLCHSFPHNQVICNQVCGATLSCGHICRNPCSANSHCSCSCATGTIEKLTINEENVAEPSGLTVAVNSETQHAEFVKGYRDFANGGAKHQDALLDARAMMIESEEMQKRLDEEAFKDLFGGDEVNTALRTPSTGTSGSDIKSGCRETYVSYFNNQAQFPDGLKANALAFNSLLDESS